MSTKAARTNCDVTHVFTRIFVRDTQCIWQVRFQLRLAQIIFGKILRIQVLALHINKLQKRRRHVIHCQSMCVLYLDEKAEVVSLVKCNCASVLFLALLSE